MFGSLSRVPCVANAVPLCFVGVIVLEVAVGMIGMRDARNTRAIPTARNVSIAWYT